MKIDEVVRGKIKQKLRNAFRLFDRERYNQFKAELRARVKRGRRKL